MSDDLKTNTGFLGVLDRGLRVLELVAILIAGACLTLGMLLISADALMRYAFNAPLVFQLNMTQDYLLVALVMMALSWGFRTGGYIRITGLVATLPRVLRNLVFRAGIAVSAGYTATLGWQAFHQFWGAWTRGEVKFGVIDYPVWLSLIWVPLGLGLLTLRLILIGIGPNENLHIEHEPIDEL